MVKTMLVLSQSSMPAHIRRYKIGTPAHCKRRRTKLRGPVALLGGVDGVGRSETRHCAVPNKHPDVVVETEKSAHVDIVQAKTVQELLAGRCG